GGGGPGTEKPGVIQLPVPTHDIGPRGPHLAPGTVKVTLENEGVAGESRMFEVRPDPGSTVTLTQHKAREAFVVEVMELQTRVEKIATDLAARRSGANAEEVGRLGALERRRGGGAGGRGGRGGGGGQGARPPVRQRLNGLITGYVGSGARNGAPLAAAAPRRR